MQDYVVRGSEYSSFLRCRKQWQYQWLDNMELKRPDGKLFLGTVVHKFLEYYHTLKDFTMAFNKLEMYYKAQDLSAMEQIDIDELWNKTVELVTYYHETYESDLVNWNVLATEITFLVKMEQNIYMTGTIDLVLEDEYGQLKFMDHKTVASIQMYEEKAQMDRQISRYWWALQMIIDGIGRIKCPDTGNWIRWNKLEGKTISGFIYNLIGKEVPKEPEILKKGGLSKNKAQKTTYKLYLKALRKHGLNELDYEDMLHHLSDKGNPFQKRVEVTRSVEEIESAAYEFFYTACDMHDVKLLMENSPQAKEQLTYRNITHDCMHMCQFKSLCQAAINGDDVEFTKNMLFRQREMEEV
jgi:hypothetical protein